MLVSLIKVKPLSDYKLLLSFVNDETRIFDMKPYLDKGIYRELINEDVIRTQSPQRKLEGWEWVKLRIKSNELPLLSLATGLEDGSSFFYVSNMYLGNSLLNVPQFVLVWYK